MDKISSRNPAWASRGLLSTVQSSEPLLAAASLRQIWFLLNVGVVHGQNSQAHRPHYFMVMLFPVLCAVSFPVSFPWWESVWHCPHCLCCLCNCRYILWLISSRNTAGLLAPESIRPLNGRPFRKRTIFFLCRQNTSTPTWYYRSSTDLNIVVSWTWVW